MRAARRGAETIRVVVADDDRLARIALGCVLAPVDGVDVVGEVGDGESIAERAKALEADVVVRGSLPGGDGAEPAGPGPHDVRTIVLGDTASTLDVALAFEAGADGYVTKARVPEHLPTALRVVAAGGRFLDPEVGAQVAVDLSASRSRPRGVISPREREVLALLSQGRTNEEIAAELSISPRTVEGHRTRLGRKLGLRRRAQLIEYGLLHHVHHAHAGSGDGPGAGEAERLDPR